jgi:4-hydroxy-3-polyprenylbenzoate decarboxylase
LERKIVLGIGGSSGSIYAMRLMTKLMHCDHVATHVVMSDNAIKNWEIEIGHFNRDDWPFKFYEKNDFNAPFASGSAKFDTMIICPSSMGLAGRIAHGVSVDLMTRAADVMLKERRKIIIVPRETPFGLIHMENLLQLTKAGAIICPASPSFYSKPATVHELVDTVVDRVLDLAGIDVTCYRWGQENE